MVTGPWAYPILLLSGIHSLSGFPSLKWPRPWASTSSRISSWAPDPWTKCLLGSTELWCWPLTPVSETTVLPLRLAPHAVVPTIYPRHMGIFFVTLSPILIANQSPFLVLISYKFWIYFSPSPLAEFRPLPPIFLLSGPGHPDSAWLLLTMDVWGVGLSCIHYSSLRPLATLGEISFSLFHMAVVGHGMLSHPEATGAPPSGPTSYQPGPVRGWQETQAWSIRPKLSLDFWLLSKYGRNRITWCLGDATRLWCSRPWM